MNRYSLYFMVTSLACVPVAFGCGGDSLGDQTSSGATGGAGGRGTGGGGTGGGIPSGSFIRVHYRLQGSGGDVKTWGAHFWGAGSTSPMWGSPQLFTNTDDFGAYTDIQVTATSDTDDAWLGLIPVQCSQGNCTKDIQTSVRFVDLEKNMKSSNIAECWITQGQAVQIKKPAATGPSGKIYRPADFIDLGDGSVRLMFRVAPGSTGTVQYGAAQGTLDKQVTWSASDDINANGLVITGLNPGAKTYYKISSDLQANNQDLKDETTVLDLTPVKFSAITQTSDWAAWGSKGVMYEVMVRTFADGGTQKAAADPNKESGIDPSSKDGVGDLVGLRNMLPYLKDLGADAIWMMPAFKSKTYHGYDTTDFYSIDPALGTVKDFVDLTTAAHALGIRVVLDLVQNHVADVNPWFVSGSNPKDADYAKYHDWFVWSDEYENMLADKHPFDPSSPVWACKNYLCYNEIFGTSLPELNYHNPLVRAEMKKIAAYWINLGADGYRLDASKHIDQFDDDHKIPLDKHGTHVWWKEFNAYVKKGVPNPPSGGVLLAGENRWDDPAQSNLMAPFGGDMDSQFDFPFRSLLSNFYAGKTGDDADFVKYLNKAQQQVTSQANGGNPNHYFERFLSNHDLDRPATQFQGAPGPLTGLLKQAATIILTVPGMPVVYYGEEVGKQGKRDKFIGNEDYDHDEFIREPMSWYQALTFTGDKMKAYDIDFAKSNTQNAALGLLAGVCKAPNPDYPFIKFMTDNDPSSYGAQKDDPQSLVNYYKQLIAIRKANPIITDIATQLSTVQNTADVYEFTLKNGGTTLTVVLNRKTTQQTITRPAMVKNLLTGTIGTSFDVPPYGALILQ